MKLNQLVSMNKISNDKFLVEEKIVFLLLDNTHCLIKFSREDIRFFGYSNLIEFKVYVDNNQIIESRKSLALDFGGIILGKTSASSVKNIVEKNRFSIIFYRKNEGRYTVIVFRGTLDSKTEQYRLIIEELERISRKLNSIIIKNN